MSLTHRMNAIDIYSNSWGESDDTDFGGPDNIVQHAIKRGISKGRRSKGSIYVWASGNSGPDDDCNADGYVNSIYTIGIASVSHHGYSASYGETCSAILAATYASGRTNIVTINTHGRCDKMFTGTSASAPIAAGLISLALQANKDLTWRDVQHLIVETSSLEGLTDSHIVTNGVGRKASHNFGFGLMRGEALVNAAKNWTLVSQQRTCSEWCEDKRLIIGSSRQIISNLTTSKCDKQIDYLEHVVAEITFDCSKRGQVEFFLTSAQGTTSKLLTKRRGDNNAVTSFTWKFMSVHYWGESPTGMWSLKMRVTDVASAGILLEWKLTFYGTQNKKNDTEEKSSITQKQKSKEELILLITFGVLAGLLLIVSLNIYAFLRFKRKNKIKNLIVMNNATGVK
uniref:Furin-like protease kpc-1 n=1 Tax=Crassostrea virginica TaxID=6565 RepID=A0A8B8AWF2_CRAVI|nr:furin-like protease kpc-1 [Crassostrea virginica]